MGAGLHSTGSGAMDADVNLLFLAAPRRQVCQAWFQPCVSHAGEGHLLAPYAVPALSGVPLVAGGGLGREVHEV
jgi:hypothetical protein